MKFDAVGIVLMLVAIALGQFVGTMLIGYLGSFGGGLMGTFIVGFVCYLIYGFITKSKFTVMNAVIFSVLIYVSNLGAGWIADMIGIGGGVLSLVITAVIASFLWGWIGGKGKRKGLLK